MAKRSHQRGRVALAASAGRSHVRFGGEGQLGGVRGPQPRERLTGGEVWHRPLLVCVQHWVALGWCQQWRQGKSLQFPPVRPALLPPPPPPPSPSPTIPGPSTPTRG